MVKRVRLEIRGDLTRVSTRGGCLHLGVSLLLGVDRDVPILIIAVYLCYLFVAVYLCNLFIAVYLCYLFIAVRGEKHLRVTRLYTRSRVFECFEKDKSEWTVWKDMRCEG